jgi:hypothetical protein
MIKSGKEKIGETIMQATISIQATSLCQSAKCGMRAIQPSFPHLKDQMIFSKNMEQQKVFLHLIAMLLNFWTHRVGLNQLSSTFYPTFEAVGDDALDAITI